MYQSVWAYFFILIKQWTKAIWARWERACCFYQACWCTHFVEKKPWNEGDNGKWQFLCSSTPLIPCSADPKLFICPVKLVPSKVSQIYYHLCSGGSHMETGRMFYQEKPQETWTSNALFSWPNRNKSWFSKMVNSSKLGSGVQTNNTITFSEPAGAGLLKYSLV